MSDIDSLVYLSGQLRQGANKLDEVAKKTSKNQSILRQAYEACLRRDYPKAYDLYGALLQTYPDDPQVFLEYGKAVYMEFEDLEKALHLFEQAFEHDPTSVEALLWQADIAAMGYGPEQVGAVSLYRRAIELDPNVSMPIWD